MKAGGEYARVDCNLSDDIFFSRYGHGRTGRTIAASPETYWNLWYMYLPLLPIAPYGAGLGFPIVHKSCKPHPSQMKLARLIAWLPEEWQVVERLRKKSFAPFTAANFMATCTSQRTRCVWTLRGRPSNNGCKIGDAKQVMCQLKNLKKMKKKKKNRKKKTNKQKKN